MQQYFLSHRSSVCGFTLVEVVLYMAFTSVILLLSGAYLLDIMGMKTRLEEERSLTQGMYFLHHTLAMHIEDANTVAEPALGETTSVLVLVGEFATTTIRESSGILVSTIDTSDHSLTARGLVVRDVLFSRVGVAGAPQSIRVEGFFCTPKGCTPFHWLFARHVAS